MSFHKHALLGATAALICAACVRTPAPVSPRAKAGETEKAPPRSPEGVVLEMATPIPPPSEVAVAEDVVVLAEPIPDEALREFVFAFFDAMKRRDMEALGGLVSEQAVTLDSLALSLHK